MQNDLLRVLPSVDRMLSSPAALIFAREVGRDRVRDLLRDIIEELRAEISTGASAESVVDLARSGERSPDDLAKEIDRRLMVRVAELTRPSLRKVVNATGVIIHTNLGRAPLANAAIEEIARVASGYSNLEYDIEAGSRGRRDVHCQKLIARLAGAEDAAVVNNNAAAVLLVLNSLAQGGEVIVSRGELIEIGGSFRIPDVMEKSGAVLREVGTTNRTRIRDYQNAVNDRTRLILRIHPSNYRIVGFTERPTLNEIAELAVDTGIPAFEDLGSGCLTDLSRYGVTGEPVVADSIAAGIPIVSFSGDKLLGGPQAGIIAGKRALISKVRENPLMRALRVDKMTYSALEATLRVYQRGAAETEVPVIRALAATQTELSVRALGFAEQVVRLRGLNVSVQPGFSVVGGGSAPGIELPTTLVAVGDATQTASAIEARLRQNGVPIITRVENGCVLIDLRTVLPEEESIIIEALEGFATRADGVAAAPGQ